MKKIRESESVALRKRRIRRIVQRIGEAVVTEK
jgi:hypothetical protein